MSAKRKNPATKRTPPSEESAARDVPAVGPPPAHGTGDHPVIVGIGSSAGGMDALTRLLPTLPTRQLTYVIIQHLAIDQAERFLEHLQEQVRRPVEMVQTGAAPQEGVAYLAPSHALVEIINGRFEIVHRAEPPRPLLPIDFFLHSLAHGNDGPGIGVLLSGMGSDGIAGLREIRAAGGIVVAQHPASAEYEVLPRAAIEAGLADLVITPEEIGDELVRLVARLPLRRQTRLAEEPMGADDESLRRVYELLHDHAGVDFSTYKPGTIRRRLQRRMVLNRLDTLPRYLRMLEESPVEVKELYQDLLIHVTRFFRDPGSFEALHELVFPRLLEGRRHDDPIRIWVPGCSTGEEAYSVAMAILEFLGERVSRFTIQVFATDLSDSAVGVARAGLYPESASEQLTPERLQRFFSPANGGYRVAKPVRDLCVFTRHDLTRDPPFSHLDLIMCRNVLIYLGATLQARVMSILHYGLKPGGYLVLGSAESVGTRADLFRVIEKRHSIYEKKGGTPHQAVSFGRDFSAGSIVPTIRRAPAISNAEYVGLQADRVLLERYAPPAVIVDPGFNIVQTRGQTGHFLELAQGEANLNILRMAREGLLYALRTALHQARQSGQTVRKPELQLRGDGDHHAVDLEVVPLGTGDGGHFLVLFEERTGAPVSAAASSDAATEEVAQSTPAVEAGARIAELQEELAGTRSYLQSMIQDLEAANEELQSANEEILSSNEELQSTNEELDTAREELQSTNEELHTLNEELHVRNEDLARVNSDLTNLLASMHIAVVMVDNDLRIRRFTPSAERILNVLPGDLGRPIGHLQPNIDCPDLEPLLKTVLERTETIEREVRGKEGSRYVMRMRPYKGVDNRIDGAMVTLLDVEELRAREREASEARRFAEELLLLIPYPLALVGPDLHVRALNDAFAARLGVAASLVRGQPLDEHLGDGSLAQALRRQRRRTRGTEVRVDLADGATLRARVLDGGAHSFLLAFIDERGKGGAAS